MEPHTYLSHTPRRSEGGLLRDLHALNRQFIALLLASSGDPGRAAMLEPCLLTRLCELSDQQLDRLATCPYSLFDMRFARAESWTSRAERASLPGARLRGTARADGYLAAFSLSALLFARQLADGYPDLARLLLGMHNQVGQALTRLALPALAEVACDHAAWLEARLASHPHFWPDLIDFVRDGTRERRLAAQTLGVQHSAPKV